MPHARVVNERKVIFRNRNLKGAHELKLLLSRVQKKIAESFSCALRTFSAPRAETSGEKHATRLPGAEET